MVLHSLSIRYLCRDTTYDDNGKERLDQIANNEEVQLVIVGSKGSLLHKI